MRDRLIELIKDIAPDLVAICGDECDKCTHGDCVGKLADHLLAEGVIVLPCKVGDTVYQINKTPYLGEIYELEIFDISLRNGKPYYETERIDFDDTAIGTSIFLTREEAEKALERSENGK